MRNLTSKIMVSVCLVFFSHSFKAQTTAQEFYEKAKQKIEQKDYQYAATLIDKAIVLDEANINYKLLKANLDWALKHYEDAFITIKKARQINPKFAETYNLFGTFYQSSFQPDSAIYMYNLAIKYAQTDSSKYSYLNNRGVVKWLYRDFNSALIDYKEVLAKYPNDTNSLNMIGQLYKDMGDTVKAIETMKMVLQINNKSIVGNVNLGLLYSEIDSLDRSLQCFNNALKLQPDEPLVYSNRGFTYYKMKRYNEALKDINKSIEMYPENSYAYKNLALVYFAQNNISEGCTALHYAERYGYETNYGDEVKKLKEKYCKN
ncbi:MAG: tetratricopeptide repeat protein [Bacteroidia bacterium]